MLLKRLLKHVHFLPVIVCLLFPLTFIVTFIIAVTLNDVFPDIPYISETGTLPPESCVFSLLLNVCAVLLGGCVYVRHLQITKFAREFPKLGLSHREIVLSSSFGALSSLGLCVVANFQLSNIKSIHYLGACSCLWGGTVFFIFQTNFSLKMGKGVRLIYTFYARYALCIISVICNVGFVVAGYMASYYYNGDNPRKWKPSEGGWIYHIISTGSEWVLATTFSILILTFLPEFKKMHIEYMPVLCWSNEFLTRHKLNENITSTNSSPNTFISDVKY